MIKASRVVSAFSSGEPPNPFEFIQMLIFWFWNDCLVGGLLLPTVPSQRSISHSLHPLTTAATASSYLARLSHALAVALTKFQVLMTMGNLASLCAGATERRARLA